MAIVQDLKREKEIEILYVMQYNQLPAFDCALMGQDEFSALRYKNKRQ
jgi:hypothetical protein